MDKLAALVQIPMFQDISPSVLEPLTDFFIAKRFERGEFLWREGSAAHNFTFIIEGQVKVSKIRPDGGETILGVFNERDSIGQIAVVQRIDYPASAVALNDTLCLEIFRDHFFATLQGHRELLEASMSGMMKRNFQLVRRLEELTTHSAEQRLAMLFCKFSDRSGKRTKLENGTMGVMIPLLLSRKDLADLINVRVETAIRMMSKWNKFGPVQTTSEGFLVTDCLRLDELAQGPEEK